MTMDYVKGDKVISLTPLRRQARFPAIGTVESYWEGLRNGRLMPTRADVDPRGIAAVLEFAFMLEKIAPGLGRIRLAGLHLGEIMGMEVRGMPVTALFLPDARREMTRVLEAVLDEPAVVRLALRSEDGFRLEPLEAQMILLPLRDETGRPTRILGALQSRGKIGRGPRRFSISDIETKPLIGDPFANRGPQDPARRTRSTGDGGEEAGRDGGAQKVNPRTAQLRRQIAEIRQADASRHQRGPHLRLVHDAARD
ncbi:PAS domain-containing protein [Maritimibacter sp. HL-12]|uniref:PAS domain-containing protein n=1 Tax=Maritimibacter sp. HL-12 TaxID=1162418 RepID=UPI000A0EEE5C|nr:PAS domain-containing protein [Maritimibacter sp. HL-12]SMH55669.1 Uncharacterized protein conserved in bacteria [Maritimibacter sp. HL-12]